jgi:hypothetical protein
VKGHSAEMLAAGHEGFKGEMINREIGGRGEVVRFVKIIA